jgi:DNA-binding IscR family transcriptional regulator
MLETVEAVDGPIRGQSPLSEDESDSPLNRKVEAICQQGADQIRRQLEKIHLSDLAGKK